VLKSYWKPLKEINLNPLVTVMMPVYNGERTIETALNSLLYQSYTNWICIIVNDCSTDQTREILDNYLNDSRFKVIDLPENRGRGTARQIALENARGSYLTFLDADDFYHPEKLESQVNILEADQSLSMVSVGIGSLDLNKNLRSVRAIGKNEKILFDKELEKFRFFPASVMIRGNHLENMNYNVSLNVAEDIDFLSRVLAGRYYLMNDRVLYFYEEIGAVTVSKLFSYQWQKLTYDFDQIKLNMKKGFKDASLTLAKILGYGLLIPILGIDKLIEKRGKKPNPRQIEAHQSSLEKLQRPGGFINSITAFL
jgi:glycosyltransferase involved in cell wall biosynthesis